METAAPVQTYAHITKVPGVCGGKASIDNTRVRVHNVVCMAKGGSTPEQIISEGYPQLSLAQVCAALAYYYDHVEEIEAELEANRRIPELVEELRRKFPQGHKTQ